MVETIMYQEQEYPIMYRHIRNIVDGKIQCKGGVTESFIIVESQEETSIKSTTLRMWKPSLHPSL